MSRRGVWGLFFVFAVILAGSVLFLVSARPHDSVPTGQALLARAEGRVGPPPAPPPAPAGARIGTERQIVSVVVMHAGHPPTRVDKEVTRPVLQGGQPADQANWEAQVEREQAAYQQRMGAELARLAAERQGPDMAQWVALITALAGLIGAVATLVTALRGRPAMP